MAKNSLKNFTKPMKVPKFVKTGGHEATPEDKTVRKSVVSKELLLQDGTAAGFVKNDGTGKNVLSGGNAIGAGDLPAHASTHEVAGADPVTITHAQTTGQTTDDHHNETHSLLSHTQGNNKVFYSDGTGDLIELSIENDPTKYLTATIANVPFFKIPDHTELATVGIDDHHDRDHAASHELLGADQIVLQSITWDAGLTYTGTNPCNIWGGNLTGEDMVIHANSVDAYPFIKWNGNGNIVFEVATGDASNFKVNNVSVVQISTSGIQNRTGDWIFPAGIDARFILSDAAGNRDFRIMDSGINSVWTCDSDGFVQGQNDWLTSGDIESSGGSLIAADDIYTTQWTDYGGTSTIVGFALLPLPVVAYIWYKKVGKLVFVKFSLDGTSNAIATTFTLPYASVNSTGSATQTATQFVDNAAASATAGAATVAINSNVCTLYTDFAAGAWTNANRKAINGQFFYEAA